MDLFIIICVLLAIPIGWILNCSIDIMGEYIQKLWSNRRK